MKEKKSKQAGITQPLLKDLIARQKAQSQITFNAMSKPAAGSTPLEQPDLYQDSGSGFNANFVFPQD